MNHTYNPSHKISGGGYMNANDKTTQNLEEQLITSVDGLGTVSKVGELDLENFIKDALKI